jgi:hypothetical protein
VDAYERIRRLRDEYEAALDEAERLREAYHREIVKLYRSGASLREIAEKLGVSHQRVHQIVSPTKAPSARGRKGVIAGAAIAAVLVAGVGAALVGRSDRSDLGRASPTPSASGDATRTVAICSFGPRDPSSTFGAITTISLECQEVVERLLARSASSVVAIDPRTGEVLAAIASRRSALELSDLLER